jgi:hypothetical protein
MVSYAKEARPWTIDALAVPLDYRQCVPPCGEQATWCLSCRHAAMVGCGAVEMSVTVTVPFACVPTPTRQGCMQRG